MKAWMKAWLQYTYVQWIALFALIVAAYPTLPFHTWFEQLFGLWWFFVVVIVFLVARLGVAWLSWRRVD
jgi:hypothetical protein